MARDIEFRVWRKKEKEYSKTDILHNWYYPYSNEGRLFVVEQYTGLNDKHSKKIFEGDIVKCVSPYWGVFYARVCFNDGCFEVVQDFDDGHFRDYLKCLVANHAVIVKGNIHENKELLSTE